MCLTEDLSLRFMDSVLFSVFRSKGLSASSFTREATGFFDTSRETGVFEMDVTEQVQGVEAWIGGNETRQAMPFQLTSCRSGR